MTPLEVLLDAGVDPERAQALIDRTEAPDGVPDQRTIIWGVRPQGIFVAWLPSATSLAQTNVMIRSAFAATSWPELLQAIGPADLGEYFEVELDDAWETSCEEAGLDDPPPRPPVSEWLPERWSAPALDWLWDLPDAEDVYELGLPDELLELGDIDRGTVSPMTGGSGVRVTWTPAALLAIDDWLTERSSVLVCRQDLVNQVFGLA